MGSAVDVMIQFLNCLLAVLSLFFCNHTSKMCTLKRLLLFLDQVSVGYFNDFLYKSNNPCQYQVISPNYQVNANANAKVSSEHMHGNRCAMSNSVD